MEFSPALAILGLLALFVIILISKGIRIVQQAEVVLVERLGKFHKVLYSGVNIIIPVIDRPREIHWRIMGSGRTYVSKIDMREQVFDFPSQSVITKDNVAIEINALLYFQITDPVKVAYEISNLPEAIEKLTQTTLRNVVGDMELDSTLSSRDKINSQLRAILDDATEKWGVKINRVELQDINPPIDIQKAMEKQMRAERDRRAMILEAEGQKQSAILIAEGQREAEIAKAMGQKQSQILVAEGRAEGIIRVAEADANAIKLISESVKGSHADPTQYLVALKYIDAFKQISSAGDKLVFMPYEATGVLSSLGMLKEIFEKKS